MRPGSKARTRRRRRAPCPAGPRSALTASRYWSAAAAVKNNDPAKNTAASAAAPTRLTNPGKGATTKHAEPTANRTPIQNERRRGAHQPVRADREWAWSEAGTG